MSKEAHKYNKKWNIYKVSIIIQQQSFEKFCIYMNFLYFLLFVAILRADLRSVKDKWWSLKRLSSNLWNLTTFRQKFFFFFFFLIFFWVFGNSTDLRYFVTRIVSFHSVHIVIAVWIFCRWLLLKARYIFGEFQDLIAKVFWVAEGIDQRLWVFLVFFWNGAILSFWIKIPSNEIVIYVLNRILNIHLILVIFILFRSAIITRDFSWVPIVILDFILRVYFFQGVSVILMKDS